MVGAPASSNLQDILRLLTLWFSHGAAPDVEAALQEGFSHVSIDTWLVVIPQIIARIHTNSGPVRSLIHSLLVRIGRHHPQALMYPLLVACKSQSPARRAAAMSVVENVRQHSATLVEQAQLVSQELIRMAILWHEMWHEALEEASRLYFGESNVEGMLNTLLPLHEMMRERGPTTLKEIAFVQVCRARLGPLGVVLWWGGGPLRRCAQRVDNTGSAPAPGLALWSAPSMCGCETVGVAVCRPTGTSSRRRTSGASSTSSRAKRQSCTRHVLDHARRGVSAARVPRCSMAPAPAHAMPAGLGFVLPRLQAHQQAAAQPDHAGAAVRRPGPRSRAGVSGVGSEVG